MAGICLISFNGSQLSLDPRGDLLAVLAAVVWAVYSLLTKQIGGYGWNVIQTTRRIFGWGILFMIPAAAVMDFRLGLERLSEPSYVGMFLYLGLGACAACFVTWNFAIKTLGPIKTMVYIYLVPVITVVCSVLTPPRGGYPHVRRRHPADSGGAGPVPVGFAETAARPQGTGGIKRKRPGSKTIILDES